MGVQCIGGKIVLIRKNKQSVLVFRHLDDLMRLTEFLSLRKCQIAKPPSCCVVGHLVFSIFMEEVHGDPRKLHMCSSPAKPDMIVIRNI